MTAMEIVACIIGIGIVLTWDTHPSPPKPRTGIWGQLDRLDRIEALKEQRRAADSQIAGLWAECEQEEARRCN